MRLSLSAAILVVSCLLLRQTLSAGEIEISPDIVYGHKDGLAMTYDVFTPVEERNGAGVLFMVSGGW
ncbi:MAG TPA: alpha/beta hydrolase, partial [Planctomycetaceae bacterium]|nr:alpha/beta hydrolase [Planctomycetaceae bacterium]